MVGPDWRAKRVADSALSTRAKNCLLAEGRITAGQVAKMTPSEILRMPDCGRKTSIEIVFWLIALVILEESIQ